MIYSRALRHPAPRFLACSVVLAACSSSTTPSTPVDAGAHHDTGSARVVKDGATTVDTGSTSPVDAGGSGGGTTTIAAARQANPTTSITVKGVVTALAGVPMDYPQWYIEDPAGGEYSGIVVYCDPDLSKPCTVPEPALNDLIEVTGTLDNYKGQVELIPTAMKVLQSNATPPPVPSLTATQVAPGADSPYRGVFVSLTIPSGSKLTVDSVTPPALADTACGAVIPDGGVVGDAAPPACTNKCEPPLYAGFQANVGGDEVYIEAPFFNTDPLQSSPECLSQAGVVPVTDGMTFSKMSGILDVDPYSGKQSISPVLPADYATP